MKRNKLLLLLIILPLFAFTSLHKYYVSVTQVNYIEDKAAVQITTRVFIDDIENALRKNYDSNLTLTGLNEPEASDASIKKYIKEKLTLKIDNEPVDLTFIGKEYDGDIMRCYLEAENVNTIKTAEISNQVLFDLYEDQQNIVKTKIYGKNKSALLTVKNRKLLLNFN